MKEPLKAPFVFLFILICVAVVISLLDLFGTWGLYDSTARAFTFSYAMEKLPRCLFETLIPSVVLSVVLIGFRLARKPFSRFLGLLIVLGMSYLCLVNGMFWLRTLSAAARAPAESPRQYLVGSTFVEVGGKIVSVRSIKEASVTGILVYDPERATGRFSVYPSGTATAQGGVLRLTAAGQPSLAISGTPTLAWEGLFDADRFTTAFLRDIGTLTSDFERLLRESTTRFFAACFSLLFLCTASLMLLRITRWPLVNIMALALATRGYFSLYHYLAVTAAPQIARVVTDRLVTQLFPCAVFAILGVLLLLVDILFIPADRWVSERQA